MKKYPKEADWMTMPEPTSLEEESNTPTRRATIPYSGDPPQDIEGFLERVRAYLPESYKVSYNSLTKQFMITGHDVAGWTLDGYVIPRLASGLVFAEEITEGTPTST